MQNLLWWWLCNDRYVISLNPTSIPPSPHSLRPLRCLWMLSTVSVYLLAQSVACMTELKSSAKVEAVGSPSLTRSVRPLWRKATLEEEPRRRWRRRRRRRRREEEEKKKKKKKKKKGRREELRRKERMRHGGTANLRLCDVQFTKSQCGQRSYSYACFSRGHIYLYRSMASAVRA